MMVVLFSTFFSSFAGGLTMVVFFSTTLSGGAVFILESQAARRNTEAARAMYVFMVCMLGGCPDGFVRLLGPYFTVTFRTITLVAIILPSTFV